MAAFPKALHRTTLTATTDSYATVPAAKTWAVTNVVVANNGTVSVAVEMDLHGTPLIPGITLAPATILTLDCAQVLNAGQQIRVKTRTAGTVGVHISGVESDAVA